MDIYVDQKGRYRLIEEKTTMELDVPNVLTLMQTVLDDEYAYLDLNIDEVLDDRQNKFYREQVRYEEISEDQVLKAFTKGIKIFCNDNPPIYKGYEELDVDDYFDKSKTNEYLFFYLKEEAIKLIDD